MMIGTDTAEIPKSNSGFKNMSALLPRGTRTQTESQVSRQRLVNRVAGVHQHVMAVVSLAAFADPRLERLERFEIALANLLRLHHQLLIAGHLLEPVKFDHPLERKFQL